MVPSQEELQDLMQRLRDGSQTAAQELYERYGHHILRVVRRKLDRKLRAKFDSVDFMQSVWTSFFVNPSHQFAFERPEELIAFLAKLAHNKLVDAQRQRYGTEKYNVNRERSLEGSAAQEAARVVDRQPTPSQLVVAEEHWDRLLEGQPDHYQRILILLRQGYTHEEIAQAVGVNEKTIRRLIRKLDPGSASS
jgi:RNA polymerase sigma-70 factor (ECF subfamily)